jgi:general secretion pathway protein G
MGVAAWATVQVRILVRRSQERKVRFDLNRVIQAAEYYWLAFGRFPQSLDEMIPSRGVCHPIEPPVDPWGQPYVYRLENGKPVATCLGRDGEEGGEGEDADIEYPER